jgi:two-component system CheB/CheR fusion protein
MAFIFVQHLAPDHRSVLVDLLAKKTSMPVVEATQGLRVDPNHFYVIPPNVTLSVAGGCLELKPRNDVLGIPMPIDDLLFSLAEEHGNNAIGVLLSGTATDGALGLHAIKSEGGITLVQDEDTAQYSSMPQSAVKLGCVDFILSPPEIARELTRISKHPLLTTQVFAGVDQLDFDEASMERIFHMLHDICNLDFMYYKRGTIKRRLARRMAVQNLSNIADYIEYLDANPDEVRLLCQDFLIHITSFFRDVEAFDNLVKEVLPLLVAPDSYSSPLRIWVPACSTGEEVYSLAICCLEYLEHHKIRKQIQIFGTDVSEDALHRARAGVYLENIVRHVSPERLKKFFVKSGENYKVSKAVRDLCIFARHNVTSDPPFSKLDLISCRNLLIYLAPLLQKRVIALFHYALKNDKILILGTAENISGQTDVFTSVDKGKAKFYIKKRLPESRLPKYLEAGVTPSEHPREKVLSASSPALMSLKKRYSTADLKKREADQITFARFVPPAVLCDRELNVLEFRGDTSPYLSQLSGAPDANLQRLVKPRIFFEIKKAVQSATATGKAVKKTGLQMDIASVSRRVSIEVMPVGTGDDDVAALIFFQDMDSAAYISPTKKMWPAVVKLLLKTTKNMTDTADDQGELERLRGELDDMHLHIALMVQDHEADREEQQASQEEFLSSNEEFQSTNEELETAKEELQSANEELITTNDEMRFRNTDLSKLNIRLKQSLDYAEAIIKTVTQPFLVLDGQLRVLHANPAFYKNFKTAPEETEGYSIFDLGDKQWDMPELRQFLRSLSRQETSFRNYEITHVLPNVGKRTMRLNGVHLAWEEKVQILLAIEDVSDYKTALETLKDNDRHKNEFLAMLSHELRNPLVPIGNALEIWRNGNAGAAAEKESQEIMGRQLRKIVRLVDDLLDVARITRGAIVLKNDTVDLAKLIQQIVETFRPSLLEYKHSIQIFVPDGDLCVSGDCVRLEQIISNLLTNAIKYTEIGGKIEVRLERDQNDILIRVIDDGTCIAADLLPYIFDLFVQGDQELDRKEGGLGIGLTLVRRLVELHGGSVSAKNCSGRTGNEFIVRLPAIPGEAVRPVAVSLPKTQRFVKRKILIIEDNVDTALTTQMLIELRGHKVQVAFGGASGISAAQVFKPDVVLLDIGLPVMDGYEVARRLRAMPENNKILLIALSGYGQTKDIEKSKTAGFDHHLIKPADTEHILSLIAGH